jgi:peptidyl-prolyl cis-trans isomerase B (cyclophilin B)
MGKKGYCSHCEPDHVTEKKRDHWLYIALAVIAVTIIASVIILIISHDKIEATQQDLATIDNPTTTTAPTESYAVPEISGKHHVEIEIKDYGTIKVELDADAAPITVDNFINLAQSGFYDGLTFHRIIDGFMMQGGDPEGTGMGGSDVDIKGEFTANGIENPLSHTRGAISMARNSYSMDSASSQFFIVHSDDHTASLDGQYACFGYVTEGMEIVDAICEYSNSVVTDNNGSIEAEDQPVITAVRVID